MANNIATPRQAEAAGPQVRGTVRTVRFIKKKETPGCKVFQEVEVEGQPVTIGTLYVKNWFAGSAESVTVTITKE